VFSCGSFVPAVVVKSTDDVICSYPRGIKFRCRTSDVITKGHQTLDFAVPSPYGRYVRVRMTRSIILPSCNVQSPKSKQNSDHPFGSSCTESFTTASSERNVILLIVICSCEPIWHNL
jgi:hypothetical protein